MFYNITCIVIRLHINIFQIEKKKNAQYQSTHPISRSLFIERAQLADLQLVGSLSFAVTAGEIARDDDAVDDCSGETVQGFVDIYDGASRVTRGGTSDVVESLDDCAVSHRLHLEFLAATVEVSVVSAAHHQRLHLQVSAERHVEERIFLVFGGGAI